MYKVTLNDKSIFIDPIKDSNLLIKLENEGFKVKYGCLAGVCGVCKLKVVEGINNIIQDDDHIVNLKENEVLLCCSKLTGDIVFSNK